MRKRVGVRIRSGVYATSDVFAGDFPELRRFGKLWLHKFAGERIAGAVGSSRLVRSAPTYVEREPKFGLQALSYRAGLSYNAANISAMRFKTGLRNWTDASDVTPGETVALAISCDLSIATLPMTVLRRMQWA